MPDDVYLITVFFKHNQSKNLDEIQDSFERERLLA